MTSESVSSSSEEHSSADTQRVTAAASGGACSQPWHRRDDDDDEEEDDLPQHVVNAKRRKVSNIASSLIAPRHLNNIALTSVQHAGLELQSSLPTSDDRVVFKPPY